MINKKKRSDIMYEYSILQWLLFFYFYCFCGWIWETGYVSVRQKKFVNRGFLHGLWIPIYGSGAIIILFATLPVRQHLILVYIFGMLAATLLELVTGMVMERLFHVRYWDYSKSFCNLKGYICLVSSLFWGVLSVLLIRFIHKPVEKFVLNIPQSILTILVLVLTILFAYDFAISFREAMDLRFILEQLNEHNTEKKRLLKKRLDVISAVAKEDVQELKSNVRGNVEELKDNVKDGIEDRVEKLKWKLETLHNTREYKRTFSILKRNSLKATERYKEVLQQMKDELKEKMKKN